MSHETVNRRVESLTQHEFSVLKIFRESFRHSQGSTEFQSYPIEYLAKKGYLKGLPITERPPNFIFQYLKPPKNHDHDKSTEMLINASITSLWDVLYGYAHVYTEKEHAFKGKEGINDLIEFIASISISFDTNRQDKQRSRFTDAPRMMMTEFYDSFLDPHASQIRRYAVLGVDAGHPGYNEMFRDIKAYIKEDPASLHKLIPAWSLRHPHVDFLTNEI